MSAIELHRETLEQLAGGDQVRPIEALKTRSTTLIETIDDQEGQRPPEDPFDPIREESEQFLAVALPLLEHGDRRAGDTVALAFRMLANQTRDTSHPDRPLMFLGLHHLLWWASAYCLAHDLLERLPSLSSIVVPNPYGPEITVFESSDLRHAVVFDRGADQTYTSMAGWLERSPLRGEMPILARDEELHASLAEADLIAALRMAHNEGRTYCHAVGAGGECRLRAHARGAHGVRYLAEAFGVSAEELRPVLHAAYRAVESNDPFQGRGALFPDLDES